MICSAMPSANYCFSGRPSDHSVQLTFARLADRDLAWLRDPTPYRRAVRPIHEGGIVIRLSAQSFPVSTTAAFPHCARRRGELVWPC